MRRLLLALMLTGSVWAGSGVAFAETAGELDCGEGLSETVFATVQDLRSGAATLDEMMPAFDGAAAQCSGNAFALHYGAMAHFTRAQELNKAQAGGAAIYDEIGKAFALSEAYWALPNRAQTFKLMNGYVLTDVAIPIKEASDLRTDLMRSLMSLHLKAGLSHPFITSETVPACTYATYWDVSVARDLLRQNPDLGAFTVGFAERIASACPLVETDRTTELLNSNVVAMQLDYAEDIAETDPDRTRDLVKRIRAYRDAILEPGETNNSSWYESDDMRLREIESRLSRIVSIPTEAIDPLVSAGSVPVGEWFLEGSDASDVQDSMGRTMDAYVSARGTVGFTSVIGKMYARTKSAPDPKLARQTVYRAAKAYDEGSWRSAETRETDVLDVVYKWLKDYEDKPAATDSQ